MNPTSLILFVVTAAVCVSCSRGGDDVSYSPPEFPEQRELTVTVLNDDVMCSNAFGITLFDSVAVVKASGTDRTAFQVLALADGKHLGSFGIVGRGENELTDYRLYAPNPLASTVVAVDQSGRVAEFDPRRAAAGEKYAASGGRIHARATGNRMHCDGGRLLFMQGMPRLCLTDMSGRDTLARYDDYPSVTDAIDGDGMMRHGYFSLFGRYACRPDGEMVCCATENGMLLEILAVEGDTIEPRCVRRFYRPELRSLMRAEDHCVRGTFAVEAGRKHIYVLYHDTPVTDELNDPVLGIFDWRGREVCRCTFDKRVFRIAVTGDESRAYCWGRDEEGRDFFGRFDLG